ncbi:hypothetical protein BDE02_01G166900 [Populus trichocarpa]|nr:hypothetical protein BDE02_01G166900 [Populus trichocarpa]
MLIIFFYLCLCRFCFSKTCPPDDHRNILYGLTFIFSLNYHRVVVTVAAESTNPSALKAVIICSYSCSFHS